MDGIDSLIVLYGDEKEESEFDGHLYKIEGVEVDYDEYIEPSEYETGLGGELKEGELKQNPIDPIWKGFEHY